MATRARTVRVVQPVPPVNGTPMMGEPEQIEEAAAPAIPPPVDGLESLMAELAGSMLAKVTVYRINRNGPASYVYQCSPEAFNLDDLRDKYGGGEFRLYIVKDGLFYRNLKINVEPVKVAPTATTAAPATPVDPMVAMLQARLAQQDEFLQEFRMRNFSPEPRQSLLGDLDLPATITAISAAIVALRPPAPPPPPPPDNSSADRAIDMLLKGIELAKELKGGDGEGDNSMMGMLKALIGSPMMAQAVASTLPQAPQPPQPQILGAPQMPTLPNPRPRPVAATAPEPAAAPAQEYPPAFQLPQSGNAELDAIGPVVVRYLPLLIAKAQNESSSQLYAEVLVDSVPDEAILPLLDIPTSTIVDYLVLIHPPTNDERPWFVSLVDEIKLMFEEEPPVPPDTGAEAAPSSTEG